MISPLRVRGTLRGQLRALGVAILTGLTSGEAEDLAALCADRAAVERVYYDHRIGDKPPFDKALPQETVERLVRADLRKEAALRNAYGIQVTPAMVEAEVQRINTTTRAPEILAELKAALGSDPERFARTVARPIVVEQSLRERFNNDDRLHADRRKQAEEARNNLLAARQRGADYGALLELLKRDRADEVSEMTWCLGTRPEEKPGQDSPDVLGIRRRFGPEAQILSPPNEGGRDQKVYFEDLPADLQRVLRVQLRQPGDVSAVIETPGGFLVYLAKEKTRETLRVATLSLPKRSYEEWLAGQ